MPQAVVTAVVSTIGIAGTLHITGTAVTLLMVGQIFGLSLALSGVSMADQKRQVGNTFRLNWQKPDGKTPVTTQNCIR